MITPRSYQKIAYGILLSFTLVTILILLFIIWFVLKNGIPVVNLKFLLAHPEEMGKAGGIFPVIIGTILLTLSAIIVAAPLGIGTAIYLTEYTKEGFWTKVIRFGGDCLAGVPSIIFGLFGYVLFVEKLRMGWSILSGGLTLAFMILPTIIRTAEESIKAVSYAYREVSFSLGGTKWQTITRVVLPSSLPGIVTGVILGIGRSVGETAAVIFTAGVSLQLPHSIFDSARTMSVHFYILAREGISLEMAYGTAAVLVIATLLINLVAYFLMHKFITRQH